MRFWSLLVSLWIANVAFAQSDTIQVKKVDSVGEAHYVYSDKVGNVWLINAQEITLLDNQFKPRLSNSSFAYGPIQSVDAKSQLKYLLFFKDQMKLQYVDNQLSEIGVPINLIELGYYQVSAVAASYNEGIWCFDQGTLQLFRIDQFGKISSQTQNLNVLLNVDLNPTWIKEEGQRVYLGDPKSGLFVFDQFGTYLYKIDLPSSANWDIQGGFLYGLNQGELSVYDLKKELLFTAYIPYISTAKSIAVQKNKILILNTDGLYVGPLNK